MNKLFISYSRKDEYFARALAVDLEVSGAEIWIDVDDIPVGSRWSSAIQEGLSESDVMLLITSSDSMKSTNVEDEWNYFLDKKKPIIILYWRTCEPHFQLWRIPRIEFRPHRAAYHQAIKHLVKMLADYNVKLTLPRDLPTMTDSFMRQALKRAIHEAVSSEKDLQTTQFDAPQGLKKNSARRSSWRLLLVSLLVAVIMVSGAVYLRFGEGLGGLNLIGELSAASEEVISPEPTPTEVLAPTQTLPALSSPALQAVYMDTTFYIRNISDQIQNISRLSFQQVGADGNVYRFEATAWQAGNYTGIHSIFALAPNRCFQVATTSRDAQLRAADCINLDGWLWSGDKKTYFWVSQNGADASFSIYWDEQLVTNCYVGQGICEFSLTSMGG